MAVDVKTTGFETVEVAVLDWAWIATHFDTTQDAFPPQRNASLLRAWEEMAKFEGGEELLVSGILEQLASARQIVESGNVQIDDVVTGAHIHHNVPSIILSLTNEVKQRALWWNNHASTVLSKSGIDGVLKDSSMILLALGMGQWLDAGNYMIEPRRVGDSLVIHQCPNIDLYREFGIAKDVFTLFPHMKHREPGGGFYTDAYKHLLFGESVTKESFLRSFALVLDFMNENSTDIPWLRTDILVIPPTWFLDPDLPRIEPKFSWIKEMHTNPIVVGYADGILPIQRDFALAGSPKRRELYKEGKYRPKVAAAILTREDLKRLLKK